MTGRTVWLASYPKSGNTWLRAVYTAWSSRLHGSARVEPVDPNRLMTDVIASARMRLDSSLGVVSSLLRPEEADALRAVADDALDQPIDRADIGPHLCKIHDAYRTWPASNGEAAIVSSRATRCAIYLVRDPRDVAVSLAHYDGVSFDRAVRWLADEGATLAAQRSGVGQQLPQHLGSWSGHVHSWIDDAPFPVHVVRYEDALDDPVAVFGAALRAAGFDCSDDDIAHAVDAASFERLRSAERSGGFRERPATTESFFRSGRSGDWRTALTSDLARQVEADHAESMSRFGYR